MHAIIRCLTLALAGLLFSGCAPTQVSHRDADPASPTGAVASTPAEQARLDFRIAKSQPAGNLSELRIGARSVYYLPPPLLSRSDLTHILPMRDASGLPFLRFTLTAEGAKKLEAITRGHIGDWLLFSIDDDFMAIARINGVSTNATMDIGVDSEQRALYVVGKARAVPAANIDTAGLSN